MEEEEFDKINFKNKDITYISNFRSRSNMPSDPVPITRNRARHLRNLPRNSSGRDATVIMADYLGGETNDRYFAAPTITFKGNEPARPQSFDEALNAGEVYEFKSKKRAEKFAAGSWKQGKARREAMKAYRKRKRNGG